jgi:phosphatidylglycerophosphate synthase
MAYGAYRGGLSPSHLTIAGFVVGLSASVGYALAAPGWPSIVVLTLLYQLAYGFDCADGQLARATRRAGPFGAWFDVTVDFVRYIAIGYAILMLLVARHSMPLAPALLISGLFLTGTVVSLHTSISLQRLAGGHSRRDSQPPSALRSLVRTLIDTPFLLLMLCLLRDAVALLVTYVVVMAVGYLFVAIVLALRRFRLAETG